MAIHAAHGTAMFTKLTLIIVATGITACLLLVSRQQRIDTFHEISQTHQRLRDLERTLWEQRCEIARRCRPTDLRLAITHVEDTWNPIPTPARRKNTPPPSADI